jgi:hypothetical protein
MELQHSNASIALPQNDCGEELIGAVKSGEFFLQAFQFG